MFKCFVDNFSRSRTYVPDYQAESNAYLGNAVEEIEGGVNTRESSDDCYSENDSIISNVIVAEDGKYSVDGFEFPIHESLRVLKRINNFSEESSSCSSGEEEEVQPFGRDFRSRTGISRCREDFFKGHYFHTLYPEVIRYNNEIVSSEKRNKLVRMDDQEEENTTSERGRAFGGIDKTLRKAKITPEKRKARNLSGRENRGLSLSKQEERSEELLEWTSGLYSRPSQCDAENGGAGDTERVSDEGGSVYGRFHRINGDGTNSVEGIDHVFECAYENRAENMINRCDINSPGKQDTIIDRTEGANEYNYREWEFEEGNGIDCATNFVEGNTINVDEDLENLGKENDLRSEVSYSELGNELDFSYRMSKVCLKLLRKKAQLERELAEFMASVSNLVIDDNTHDLETKEVESSQEKYSVLKNKKRNPFSVIHTRFHNKSILESISGRYDYIGNRIFENATDLEAQSNESNINSGVIADLESEEFSVVNPCSDDIECRRDEENGYFRPISECRINPFSNVALDYHFRPLYDTSGSTSIHCDREAFTCHRTELYEADRESIPYINFQLENRYFSEISRTSSQIQIDKIIHNVSSFDSIVFNMDFTYEPHNPEGEYYEVVKPLLNNNSLHNRYLERISDIDVTLGERCPNSGHIQYCPNYRDSERLLDESKEQLMYSKNFNSFSYDNKNSTASVVDDEYKLHTFENLEGSSTFVRTAPVDCGETSAMTNREKNRFDRSWSTDLIRVKIKEEELEDIARGVDYPNDSHYKQYEDKMKRMPYLRKVAVHSREGPVSTNCKGIKCPVCSKFVLPDDIECHLVMCLTKPRLSYNEDILGENKGECVICLEDLLQGDTIARLPCLCIYHKGCIDRWFEVNRSCPEHPGD